MRFGVNVFPSVEPSEKSAADFYDETLALAERADALGFHSLKIVEHYFYAYGGYSPDPITFLAAASQRTKRLRLVTGAVLPVFNHPIKVATQLAMLDNLCNGRLDAGFGRAFLPGEFAAFQVPLADSRARFDEGIEAVKALWTREEARFEGRFHQFGPVRLLPRPVQRPHPPIWVAATFSPESFEGAGRNGYHLMMVPYVSSHEEVGKLVRLYRQAWRDAGHPAGKEQIQLSYHCYVTEDGAQAREEAREYFEDYTSKLFVAARDWSSMRSSQYPGYEHLVSRVRSNTFESHLSDIKLFVGSPAEVIEQVKTIRGYYGEIEPSLQFSFGNMPPGRALRSLELFASRVIPEL